MHYNHTHTVCSPSFECLLFKMSKGNIYCWSNDNNQWGSVKLLRPTVVPLAKLLPSLTECDIIETGDTVGFNSGACTSYSKGQSVQYTTWADSLVSFFPLLHKGKKILSGKTINEHLLQYICCIIHSSWSFLKYCQHAGPNENLLCARRQSSDP